MIAQSALPWILGALVGSMIFFAVIVAPTVFRALTTEQGGAFLRRFFPRYYLWGIVLATLCSLVALLADDTTTGSICLVVTALFVYARQFLMPRINRARDRELAGDTGAAASFRHLHLQSVVINGVQLLSLLALSAWPLWG